MKRILVLLLCLSAVLFAGCGEEEPLPEEPEKGQEEQEEEVKPPVETEEEEKAPKVYTNGLLSGTRLSPELIDELTASPDYGILSPFNIDGSCGLVTQDGCIVLDAVCSGIYKAEYVNAQYSRVEPLDIYSMVRQNAFAVCALDGSWTTEFCYEDVISCREGVLCVEDGKTNRAQYINEQGQVLFDTADFPCLDELAQYNSMYLSQWGDGYCPVSLKDGTFAYIDMQGNIVSRGYEMALEFSDGIAAVQQDGLWGYINTEFEYISPPQFLGAFTFCGGVGIAVDEAYIYRLISPEGEVLGSYEANTLFFGSGGKHIEAWEDSGRVYYSFDGEPILIEGQAAKSSGELYYITTSESVKILLGGELVEIKDVAGVVQGSTEDMLCVYLDDEFSAIAGKDGTLVREFSNCNMYIVTDKVTGIDYVVVEDMVTRGMSLYDGEGNCVAEDVIGFEQGPVNGLVQCRSDEAQGCRDLSGNWVMSMA